MSIMFASTRPGQQGSNSGNLLEFKAGRTNLESGTAPNKKKAVADPARGLIYIKQSSDQLMHFYWKNRDRNTVDLDLIIFPDDAEFIKIKECTDGRVYMLKFKSGQDHKLFWLQEPRNDKDDDLCKKVNDLLNKPPSATRARAGGSERGAHSAALNLNALNSMGNAEDIGALGNMDQNQIMQLFQLMHGGNPDLLPPLPLTTRSGSPPKSEPRKNAAPAEAPPATGSEAPKFDANMLNQILTNLPPPKSEKEKAVELGKILTRSNVGAVVKEHADELAPHLPSTSDKQELENTVGSPQSVDFFNTGVQMGVMGAALKQFNLPENAVNAANEGNVRKLCEELQKSLSQTGHTSTEADRQISREAAEDEEGTAEAAAKKNPVKDEDEDMDLD